MKTLLHLVLLLSASSMFAQINPVESHWIQNGLEHSAVKSNAFYQIDSLGKDSTSAIFITADPDVLGAYQNEQFKVRAGADVQLRANFKQKVRLMADYRVGYTNQILLPYQSVLQSKAYLNTDLGNGQTVYHDLRGRLVYEPNKYIQFQGGLDRRRSITIDGKSRHSFSFCKYARKVVAFGISFHPTNLEREK